MNIFPIEYASLNLNDLIEMIISWSWNMFLRIYFCQFEGLSWNEYVLNTSSYVDVPWLFTKLGFQWYYDKWTFLIIDLLQNDFMDIYELYLMICAKSMIWTAMLFLNICKNAKDLSEMIMI